MLVMSIRTFNSANYPAVNSILLQQFSIGKTNPSNLFHCQPARANQSAGNRANEISTLHQPEEFKTPCLSELTDLSVYPAKLYPHFFKHSAIPLFNNVMSNYTIYGHNNATSHHGNEPAQAGDADSINLTVGIDESGRGEYLGPLTIGCCVLSPAQLKLLSHLKIKDSKSTSKPSRLKLAQLIKKECTAWRVVHITASEIDWRRKSSSNMNQITFNSIKQLLVNLTQNHPKFNVCTVIIDSLGTNSELLSQQLTTLFPNLQFRIFPRADATEISCSAASLLAKSERDEYLQRIENKYAIKVGSGNYGDEISENFLREYNEKLQFDEKYKHLPIVRHSWKLPK
jgi:ribonuclease H